MPSVSVVISTRNRTSDVIQCVESVLENRTPSFELLLIDQGDDNALESALRPFARDPRLRYARTMTRGLATGRNLGIRKARSDLVACTDDDCRVPKDWLPRMRAALMVDDRVAAVYGNVRPSTTHHPEGFIPGCLRATPFIARSIRDQHRVDGMAGCLGLRQSAWKRLGGFDEMLGAGARFFAAEDIDFSIRVLLNGYFVSATPEVEVTHNGLRSWSEGKRLIEGYLYGIGAMVAKHIKCGNWGILYYLAHLALRWTFTGPVVEFGHHPPRWLRLKAFLRGYAAGFTTPIMRGRSLFKHTDAFIGSLD
jgi:GT2 family glycosyltransferase